MSDEDVLDMIRGYFPEAEIKQSFQNHGSYKIRVPQPVNKMSRYEELRKALKDSGAPKPICPACLQSNTRFRYFDNNSSCVVQARYNCQVCSNSFTLGGKQYAKDQNLNLRIGEPFMRPKREMEEPQLEVADTKRPRWEDYGRPTGFSSRARDDYDYDYYYPRLPPPREITYQEPQQHRHIEGLRQTQFQQQRPRLSLFDYNVNPLPPPPPFPRQSAIVTTPLFSYQYFPPSENPFSYRQNPMRSQFTLPIYSSTFPMSSSALPMFSSSALSMSTPLWFDQGGASSDTTAFDRHRPVGFSGFASQGDRYRPEGFSGFARQIDRPSAVHREVNLGSAAADTHDVEELYALARGENRQELSTDLFTLISKDRSNP